MQSCLFSDQTAVSSWSASAPLWAACRQLGAAQRAVLGTPEPHETAVLTSLVIPLPLCKWHTVRNTVCKGQEFWRCPWMTRDPGHRARASLCWFSSEPRLLCKAHIRSGVPRKGNCSAATESLCDLSEGPL